MTIEKYGPKLLAFWRRAVEGEVKLEVASRAQATNLRHRLYRLRTAMRADRHELYPLAARVTLRVESEENKDGEVKWYLLAGHTDAVFDDVLKDLKLEDAPDV